MKKAADLMSRILKNAGLIWMGCFLLCSFMQPLAVSADSVFDLITTEDSSAEEILAYQCEDGGFTYAGSKGDPDTTAMTLRYLSRLNLSEEQLEAYQKAWDFVLSYRTDEGDYNGFYDKPTSETTSQTILAMVEGLKAGYFDDEELLNEAVEALKTYYTAEDGYAHTRGGTWNQIATEQAEEALCAYAEYTGVPEDTGEREAAESEVQEPASEEALEETEEESVKERGLSRMQVFCIIIAAVALIYIAVIVYIAFQRKKSPSFLWKRIGATVLAAALLLILLHVLDIRSVDEHAEGLASQGETIRITMSLESEVGERVLMEKAEYSVPKDASVLYATLVVLNEEGIPIEYKGTADSNNDYYGNAYVEGIAGLYEKDYGDLSGWTYYVNDDYASVGCGEYILQDGDDVLWLYYDGIQ